MGGFSLYRNTTGRENTAVGAASLYNNTTGSYNTAVGQDSMRNNTTGNQNSAFGDNALYKNTTGSHNTAIGRLALNQNTTGRQNTSIGSWSLKNNTTGSYNFASGNQSLLTNTTGEKNTASGTWSLRSNTTGNVNTALGASSLYYNKSGSQNTAIGYQAGMLNRTGSGNVFLGYKAGAQETGSNKLYIANGPTSNPLVYGDFNSNELTINGSLTITDELVTDTIYHSDGTKMLSMSGGTVHLGPTSMVFRDSSVSSSGADTMASSVGRIQIGESNSDVTTFVGSVNVPDPSSSSNAASKRYVDAVGAIGMAMTSSKASQQEGTHLGLGTAYLDGQSAVAATVAINEKKRSFNFSLGYNSLTNSPGTSAGMVWSF